MKKITWIILLTLMVNLGGCGKKAAPAIPENHSFLIP